MPAEFRVCCVATTVVQNPLDCFLSRYFILPTRPMCAHTAVLGDESCFVNRKYCPERVSWFCHSSGDNERKDAEGACGERSRRARSCVKVVGEGNVFFCAGVGCAPWLGPRALWAPLLLQRLLWPGIGQRRTRCLAVLSSCRAQKRLVSRATRFRTVAARCRGRHCCSQ